MKARVWRIYTELRLAGSIHDYNRKLIVKALSFRAV